MIQLTATDPPGVRTAQQTFNVTATYFPVLGRSVPDQVAGIGLFYQWNIPSQTFADPLGRVLQYFIRANASYSLPNWLIFSYDTRSLIRHS